MKTVVRLLKGELRRMVSNRILPISLVTSLIWVAILFFLSREEALRIAPLLIFMDSGIMSVLLIGASHHLERQDGTIRSMMVMPVVIGQIAASKILASLVLGLESALLVCLGLFIAQGEEPRYFALLPALVSSCIAHSLLGFTLALRSRDFSSVLGMLFVYMFLFTLPGVLFSFGIIPARFEWLLMLSPAYAAQTQISSAFTGANTLKSAVGFGYLTLLSAALYMYVVIPGFRRHAARG